ncbi:MAG: universal stress protein [bacterium]|nr:universal stress protein [bacterium]MDE0603210.1 universal stress protein [bacterium]
MADDVSEPENRIVVGVEGSGGARAALRWAIKEARHRNAFVDVVTAYSTTYVPASPDFNYVPLDPIDLEVEVKRMQDSIIDEVLAEVDAQGVEIRRRMLRGRAADTLIAESVNAAMLVVGSRGRGGFRGLLLGSVSQQIAQHGSCPVVIVRPDLPT